MLYYYLMHVETEKVESITTREACIREMLARSSYCHIFKLEECLSACEKYGLPPTDLPAIVEELNRRRAHMDSSARLAHHIIEAAMPAAVPERPAPNPPKMGFWSGVVDVFLHIAYFLSPLLAFLVLIVLCLPYALFEWLLEVRHGFSFAALGLTVAFWILLFVCLSVTPWKKLRPNREWLLAPIRYLRSQFRRLEKATRPLE